MSGKIGNKPKNSDNSQTTKPSLSPESIWTQFIIDRLAVIAVFGLFPVSRAHPVTRYFETLRRVFILNECELLRLPRYRITQTISQSIGLDE